MADFQPQIPQWVKNLVGKEFLECGWTGRSRPVRIKKHDVDIAQRAQFRAAVSAQRNQANRGRRFAVFRPPGVDGVGKKLLEQPVDFGGLGVGDLQTRLSRLVPLLDAFAFSGEILLAGSQTLSGCASDREIERGRSGRRGGHGHLQAYMSTATH
jgi:hypothetical protein